MSRFPPPGHTSLTVHISTFWQTRPGGPQQEAAGGDDGSDGPSEQPTEKEQELHSAVDDLTAENEALKDMLTKASAHSFCCCESSSIQSLYITIIHAHTLQPPLISHSVHESDSHPR